MSISNMKLFVEIFAMLFICDYVQGIQKGDFILGQTITLYCPVKVKGMGLSVKSITWEKDGEEFYKNDPDISPYGILSNINGVHLQDDVFFNGTKITIGPATTETAGFYTCVAELKNPLIPGLKFYINVDFELEVKYFDKIHYIPDDYDYQIE